MWNRGIAISIVSIVSCAMPAVAIEGRVPLIGPTTITTPGSYIVTQDFSVAGGDGITISASNVTLDFNGHTITHDATAGANVRVPAGFSSILIRNGRLVGGDYGVRTDGIANDLVITIERVEVIDPLINGLLIRNAGVVEVRSSIVRNSGSEGMYISGGNGLVPFTGRFVDNTVEDSTNDGMRLGTSRGVEITGNQIRNTGNNDGLSLAGCTGARVEGNSVSQASGGGAFHRGIGITGGGSDQNLILNNTIRGFYGGIYIASSGNRIAGNVVQATSYGVQIWGARNLIEGNQIEGSGGCGIHFANGIATGNAYRDNMLRGNAGGGICGVAETDAGGNIL